MKRSNRRCMNIPDYFLGKPYHKVISRGEQIKPNLLFVRDSDSCAFVRPTPRANSAEKCTRAPCEIHGDHIPPATPVTTSNSNSSERGPSQRPCCGLHSPRVEPDFDNNQRSSKTKGNPRDNQKPPGATFTTASPCTCAYATGAAAAASPLTHSHPYPPIPNFYGMTGMAGHQEHRDCHHSYQLPARTPATVCPHIPIEEPKNTNPHVECACKRPIPTPRVEIRPSGCCCTDDTNVDGPHDYAMSDGWASDSSTGAVVEDPVETGESKCISCHHYQLVCCCRHGVLYGTS